MSETLELPSCLSQSTLGDVLGALHRRQLSGVLQVFAASECNEIELQHGFVVKVMRANETSRLGDKLRYSGLEPEHIERVLRVALARSTDDRPLGERLLATRAISPAVLGSVLQELHQARLEQMFCLTHGKLRFRVAHRATASALVMSPVSFLHQRRRYRDRSGASEGLSAAVRRAYQHLGVMPGASVEGINAAFRSRAARCHPDKFAHLGAGAVEDATRRFRDCLDSYRLLVDGRSRG